jgi:CubicO group peptidase (beta-lactamase class C family)
MRVSRRLLTSLVFSVLVAGLVLAERQQPSAPASRYFPPKGAWDTRQPAAVGLDPVKLQEAIAFAATIENQRTKDLAVDTPNSFRNEAPYNNLIGPAQERAGLSGVVIRKGYVAAAWGDTERADMTFSVTKTFLSTVVGEAYERGLIKALTDRVAPYMPAGVDLFTSEHNAGITWEHLLRQTSDWSGTLWGKPDWADRPPSGQTPEQWPNRTVREPGTFYKYNDTRVNVLSLATLYVMKEPLPVVLKREIMDPIGASTTWHWEPYENAYVTIDGTRMPSVPGGGHHGGGMFINAWDMARFGYLFLNKGAWAGRRLVTEKWIELARTPGPANTQYGFMNWFLNTPSPVVNGSPAQQMYRAAPASAVAFRGNGENIIYIDWEHDLVVVVRWISRGANDFFGRVIGALTN